MDDAAPVIVVLGAPNAPDGTLSPQALSRVTEALRVAEGLTESNVLPTGGFGDHFNRSARPHHEWLARALAQRGLPTRRLLPGVASSHTGEDAAMVADAVGAVAPLVVVTSDFHVERARWHFRAALPGRPIEFRGAPSDTISPHDLERLRAHEVAALARLEDNRH